MSTETDDFDSRKRPTPPDKAGAASPDKAGAASPDRRGRILRLKPGPLRRAVILLIVLVIIFGLGGFLSGIWTEHLWYEELGYTTVYWTPVWAQIVVGLFFATVFFVVFYGSLWLARRISRKPLPTRSPGTDDAGTVGPREPSPRRKWTGRLILIFSAIAAVIVGVLYSPRWEEIFLFFSRTDFGYTDPLFGRDASFYVFTLPVWSMLVNFAGIILLTTFIATVLIYLADRAVTTNAKGRARLAPHVKAHLSAVLALAMVTKAGDYMIQSWQLTLAPGGVVFGAGYTDVHARLPVFHFLAIVSLIAAVIFVVNIRYRGWRLPALAVVIMLLTWAIAGKAYPAIIQQYRVAPNEITAEQEFIAHNIEATRWAYGLSDITTVFLDAGEDLTADDILGHSATIDNIRLWDPRPALSTYSQIQEIRLYYSFTDVDVGRYTIDGRYRAVLLSARELDQSQLHEQSQTWVNKHFVYTHGYGLVLSPVSEAGADGLPILMVRDIPPRTDTDLRITRPEIYYGELGNEYVVVRTKIPEFDYPMGDTNVTAFYQGQGGVAIGNVLRRAAFAFRFREARLLFSESLTDESRIMFRRTIRERVEALAPFLQYDNDPYLVIRDDGSLVWMWDAFTTSNRFPYSQPTPGGINYIRNPVKVVINAYDGRVTFYQIDPHDPITNAWGQIFDGLFTPGNLMPADLRAHMRYPQDLYSIQAQVLATYHMKDPVIFYNKEDAWEIPTELYGREEIPVRPYYQVLALPGETEPEFALLQPFAPLGKNNLISILIARQDGERYGDLVLIDLPKDRLIFGPSQVEARITNDPVISSQLTLWDQAGSRVIRGNLLVIPIGRSIMYFEPLYLQAEQNSIPELTRVIVGYADKVVMEPTLTEALVRIFGEEVRGGTTTTTVSPPTTAPGATTTTLPADAAALIAEANRHFQAAVDAQQRSDWVEYGRSLELLGRVLEALEALTR